MESVSWTCPIFGLHSKAFRWKMTACAWLWPLLVLLSSYPTHSTAASSCHFPSSWAGTWFQSGIPKPLYINRTSVSTKGRCIQMMGDKYLIEDKRENTYRCVVIHEKHRNVLQYKEAFSDRSESLDHICSFISGDAPLYSMFRVDADPVKCPFKGPFTFSYSRGDNRECKYPSSNVHECTDDWRMLLRFQACPDVLGSESSDEELVCLAYWKEGSMMYVVGKLMRKTATSDEDRYRCFAYERQKDTGNELRKFQLAQSGDATCNGLATIEGSRTLRLTRGGQPTRNCTFPNWVTMAKSWHSLDGKLQYVFNRSDNASLQIVSGSGIQTRVVSQIYCSEEHRAGLGSPAPTHRFSWLYPASSGGRTAWGTGPAESGDTTALPSSSSSDKSVTLVTDITSGCDIGFVCVAFYHRGDHVIEVQTGSPTLNKEEACSMHYFDRRNTPFVTLITTSPESHQCPALGKYNLLSDRRRSIVSDSDSSHSHQHLGLHDRDWSVDPSNEIIPSSCQGFSSLRVGCNSVNTIEFESDCPSDKKIASYECHASWVENGTNFLITSVKGKGTRYCFVYTEGDKGFQFSSVEGSCHRNVQPGVGGVMAFNVTSNGDCSTADDNAAITHKYSAIVLVSFSLISFKFWLFALR